METVAPGTGRTTRSRLLLTLNPMAEQQRGRRAIEVGPTGRYVAANIARLRERKGMTTRQLSGALERAGRAIPASGITRMEKGERVVTVDELMALATVLGASPQALLFPLRDDPAETIEITGAGTMPADAAWEWIPPARQPLRMPAGIDPNTALLEFVLANWPPRAYKQMRDVLLGRLDAMAYDDEEAARRRDSARRLAAERQDPPIGEFIKSEEPGENDG
jgi:transcriptional regulator with XRE-family HTH domain